MTYRKRLYGWCIVRLLPQFQRVTVARFRRRSEAENHLKILQRLIPDAAFAIVFDLPEPASISAKAEPLNSLPPKP